MFDVDDLVDGLVAFTGCFIGADATVCGFGAVVEEDDFLTWLPWARASAHDRTGGLLVTGCGGGVGDKIDDCDDDGDAESILGDAWCDDDVDDGAINVLEVSVADATNAELTAGVDAKDNADLAVWSLDRSSRAFLRTYFRRGGNGSPGFVYHGSWSY